MKATPQSSSKFIKHVTKLTFIRTVAYQCLFISQPLPRNILCKRLSKTLRNYGKKAQKNPAFSYQGINETKKRKTNDQAIRIQKTIHLSHFGYYIAELGESVQVLSEERIAV